MSKHCNRTNKH